jgi:hypothetical protein
MVVAIDFTGSNGAINKPSSLHYWDPTGQTFNQYQHVIASVGGIVESYDTDKMFPVVGFGASQMGPDGLYGPVSHCFSLNPLGLEVHGIGGVLQAYANILPQLKFSGPTLFAPLLEKTLDLLNTPAWQCTQSRQKYTILLIITDGEIVDMPETINMLVRCSDQPISVIIVGVGNADFTSNKHIILYIFDYIIAYMLIDYSIYVFNEIGMNQLDGDGKMLKSSSGISAVRDIVQFVP